MEKILCAAIDFFDGSNKDCKGMPENIISGLVLSGYRHKNIKELYECKFLSDYITGYGYTEGFLTSQNRFVNREEAFKIALTNGQISNMDDTKRSNGQLSSEDLY